MKKPAKIIPLILIASSYLLLTKPLIAQSAAGLSAIPPRLEITVQPDGSSSQIIKVRNESKEPKTVTVDVKDIIVTDNKGTPTIVSSSDESSNRWAASNWIQVSPNNVLLKPGETKSLTLTVMPPANALPGGHYAMALHTPQGISTVSSTGASIQTQVGTLIYITIPGDINQSALVQSFTAPKFSEFGPINFLTTIKNLSDIHIQPIGAITIKNWFGRQTSRLSLQPEDNIINIFPYTTRDFNNTLNKKWLFGRYQATLQASYGNNGGLITSSIFFWVIPWRLIILGIAAISIVTTLVIISKKRPTKKLPNNEVAELEKELEELKKKYKDQ
ncbi:hypothetical protein SDC9_99048 [bioreactor metagenome]|uniref:Alpha-galactosidase NEW3 domain-containing protein n=1 Tax=bioreactor metagenome TaxID=1076179 RepID=A0A645AGH8_9ZZZZ